MRPPFSLNFIEWGLGQKYFVLNHWKKKEERMSMEKGGKQSFSMSKMFLSIPKLPLKHPN